MLVNPEDYCRYHRIQYLAKWKYPTYKVYALPTLLSWWGR